MSLCATMHANSARLRIRSVAPQGMRTLPQWFCSRSAGEALVKWRDLSSMANSRVVQPSNSVIFQQPAALRLLMWKDRYQWSKKDLRRSLVWNISELKQGLALLSSKIPRGFEGFAQKKPYAPGANAPPRQETPRQETASNTSKESPKESSKQNEDSGRRKQTDKEKGGGAPGSGGGFPQNWMMQTLIIGAAGMTLLIYMLPDNGTEIHVQAYLSTVLESGKVEKLQVVNNRLVRVYLRDSVRESSNNELQDIDGYDHKPAAQSNGAGESRSAFFFNVGSLESFERKHEQAQAALGIRPGDMIPIYYTNEVSLAGEILKHLPMLILLGIGLLALREMSGPAGGGRGGGGIFNVGKAKPTIIKGNQQQKVSFKDVAGLAEAKVEVVEFVEFLKNPDRFKNLGAKIPKGALLCGPPGTGKTLLAKAMAGEAGVPFLSMSGSDFIEMFVGIGASRVRDLFAQARENAPCIVFIDEVDAIGRARGKGGFGGGNEERENTLNQLLVEMDGFNPITGIVVLAGTNRADILDPALLRPGRFDRQIVVDRPDIKGRHEIFLVHLRALKLADDIGEVAKRMSTLTPGFAGADIANVCNEAALIAARRDKTEVGIDEFEAAVERVIGGLEKKGKVLSLDERRCVAYHEAGHALCGWFLEHADPLLKVSIVPRGSGALGYNQFLPKELALHSVEQLLDSMCMALGGRAAEEEVFGGRVTTGASDDLNRVTKLAYAQITVYGMNRRIGALSYPQSSQSEPNRPFSEATAQLIDEEARKMVASAYERTKALIRERREQLNLIAETLLKKETLVHDDLVRLLGRRPFEMTDTYREFVDTSHQWKHARRAGEPAPAAGDAPAAEAQTAADSAAAAGAAAVAPAAERPIGERGTPAGPSVAAAAEKPAPPASA